MSIIMARWKWATAPALRSDAETSHIAGHWRKLSPSVGLMILGAARGVRSETPGPGVQTATIDVTVLGETDPLATGRTGELVGARSRRGGAPRLYRRRAIQSREER
jgi:hypothetical protein